jgi:hypothetical protein
MFRPHVCRAFLFAASLFTMYLFVAASTPPQDIQVRPPEPLPRVDPLPKIDVTIKPIPKIDIPPITLPRERSQVTLPTPTHPTTVMPPPPRPVTSEASDCTVREFQCAKSCSPLPDQWSSYRSCLEFNCKTVEQSCLEKLIEDIRNIQATEYSIVTFRMKCDYEKSIELAFYSQDRNIEWAGDSGFYKINDYDTHTYRLRCKLREKICYGAEPPSDNVHWGVGLKDQYGCQNCCAVCDGNSYSYNLK